MMPDGRLDMGSVLVVEDEPQVRQMIRHYFDSCGIASLEAGDGTEALTIFREQRPPVVLTDVVIPKINGVDLLRAIKKERPDTAVIVMTGFGTDDIALETLREGAANFLRKPFQLAELGRIIRRCLAWFNGNGFEASAKSFMGADHVSFSMPNDPHQVPGAIRVLWSRVRPILGDAWIMPFRAGVEEIILNGLEHGNLAIPFEEKSAALESNSFEELLAERGRDPELSKRQIQIEMSVTAGQIRCTVTDDGNGFDWRRWIERPLDEILFAANGRGISLARVHAHTLSYNDKGNQATLVWDLSRLDETLL